MYKHLNDDFCILEVKQYDNFENVYKIFQNPPYNERWTDEEIFAEYKKIVQNGIVFGAYVEKKCVGIVALREKNQPLKFDGNVKALYLSDLAVLHAYRNKDIALNLVNFAIEYAKERGYNKLYLRTLENASSYEASVFVKVGFTKMYDICEVVKVPRTRVMKIEDCRFFWEYDVK